MLPTMNKLGLLFGIKVIYKSKGMSKNIIELDIRSCMEMTMCIIWPSLSNMVIIIFVWQEVLYKIFILLTWNLAGFFYIYSTV